MKYLSKSLSLIMTMILSLGLFSQNIGINEDGSTPNSSAILDIKASNKGFLMPRLTSTQRNNISLPAEGLIVYDTSTSSFWHYNGTVWTEGTGEEKVWTVSGSDVHRASGNVGIGVSNPNSQLHLQENSANPLAMQFTGQVVTAVSGNRVSNDNIGTSINSTSAASWVGASNAAAAVGGAYWTGGEVGNNDRSDYLNIRFNSLTTSIPVNATITGYQVYLTRRASDNTDIYDYNIRLMNGSSPLGTNKALYSTPWPTFFGGISYGSTNDTWGTNIPLSQINAGQLGIQIQYEGDIGVFTSDERGYVDYARVTIYYTIPGAPAATNWVIGTAENEFRINQGTSLASTPSFKIDATGYTELLGLRLASGSGLNRVLSSDANGNASWTDLNSLSPDWSLSGNNLINMNSGNVQIGGAWAGPFASSSYKLTVSGDTYANSGPNTILSLFSISDNTVINGSSHLKLERSYGTIGAETPLPDGVLMGTIDFSGRTSAIQLPGAQISSRSVGDWSTATYSADIRFSTKNTTSPAMVDRIIIDESGNLGIGELDPTFALHLPNDAITGLARAHTWSTYSDKRIKTDIRPLQSSLSTLMQLQPVGYVQHPSEFKEGQLSVDESQGEPKQGFIAQDLYDVLPHAVHKPEDESKQLWGVDYSSIIPLLTSAIQEQQAEIEALKALVERLQAASK